MLKDKRYVIINMTGLALGMSCALLIILHLLKETSYDAKFSDSDRIYRVSTKFYNIGNFAGSSPSLKQVIEEEVSWAEEVVQVTPMAPATVKHGDILVATQNLTLMASSNFFNVFDYPILHGNKEDFLVGKNKIVVSAQIASRLFKDDSPLNKEITMSGSDDIFTISGVFDNRTMLSHLAADVIISQEDNAEADAWDNVGPHTYVKVMPGISITEMQPELNGIIKTRIFNGDEANYNEWQTSDSGYDFIIFPLDNIYFEGKLKFEAFQAGNKNSIYILFIVGLFVVCIAAFNFINLTTSRALKRLTEVGIRKTMGSTRYQLIFQFVFESTIICFLSFVVAIGLSELLIIGLGKLSLFDDVSIRVLQSDVLVGTIATFLIGVSLLSSLYPAIYISRFSPLQIMRRGKALSKKSGLRSFLVVIQFVTSITLAICTVTIYQQTTFLKNHDLGFRQNNALLIKQLWNIDSKETFRDEVMRLSGVNNASLMSRTPGDYNSGVFAYSIDGKSYQFESMVADANFAETLGLLLTEGRSFSKLSEYDTASVILNQEAVDYLNLENPIGTVIQEEYTVIGVVNNFNYQSLSQDIEPLLIFNNQHNRNNLVVSIEEGVDIKNTIAQMNELWLSYQPESELDYAFLDENYGQRIKKDEETYEALLLITGISLFISFLGIVGLCAYMIEHRTKEIGVRIVLGATYKNIIQLIGNNFSKLIVLAFIIASPLAYWVMNRWLSNFTYQINQNVIWMLGVGLLLFMTTWLLVATQTVNTVNSNPVNSLKDD